MTRRIRQALWITGTFCGGALVAAFLIFAAGEPLGLLTMRVGARLMTAGGARLAITHEEIARVVDAALSEKAMELLPISVATARKGKK